MGYQDPFDDLPVLGKLPPELAAVKLREIGDLGTAEVLEQSAADVATEAVSFGVGQWLWPFQDKPWQHTAHAFGYLAPVAPGDGLVPIRHAGNITADLGLKNARIKITLDRLRVASYPGGGLHRVLFDFYAQNQVAGGAEDLHFNATFRVREGEHAAAVGFPIFVGLNVGTEGVSFRCYTVNIGNQEDEGLLGFLESDVFKSGLRLATTAQPAIAPLAATAVGLTKALASRNRNVPVQDFALGLDFSAIATRARLAEGSYLAVQVPEAEHAAWNWDDWAYHPPSGQVVSRADSLSLLPYNYLVFSISRFDPGSPPPAG
jgi:hypothetical protein